MAESYGTVTVPGSTANLGPAFDALAVALDLHLRATVVDVLRDPGLELETEGAPVRGDNRIQSAFALASRRFGAPSRGLRVRVSCDIPMSAGLGSSAAAAVCGLRLYEIARKAQQGDNDLLGVATELEGHPDNAAASLLGGLTLSCQLEDGRVIARAWDWPAEVRFVAATPDVPLATSKARGVLPGAIPLGDAVANLQRALLLVRALETRRYEDVREALKDRWHQPVRCALVRGLEQAMAIDDPSVLGVYLSGAGPSIMALAAPGGADEASARLADVFRRLGVPHTIRNLAAAPVVTPAWPLTAANQVSTA